MANLNLPVIVIPSECKGAFFVVGTGSPVKVHTCISGSEEIDAVTITAWATVAGNAIVRVPTTAGGTSDLTVALSLNTPPVTIIERETMCNGGEVWVNGAATTTFKISVERYPVGKNGPQAS